MKIVSVATAFSVSFWLCACAPSPDAETAFELLKKCAGSALQKEDEIVYFGPNSIPIGSIFQRMGKGAYDTLWPGTDITGENPPSNLVLTNPPGSCTINGKTSLELKAASGIDVNPIPVSLELSEDLKTARVTELSVDSFSWDILYKGPYKARIFAFGTMHPIYREINQQNRYATIALLKAKNYRVVMDINSSNISSLKAKYSGPVLDKLNGDVGGNVKVSWTSDDKMELRITDEVYLAGVLRPFKAGQLEALDGGDDIFGPSPNDGGQLNRIKRPQ